MAADIRATGASRLPSSGEEGPTQDQGSQEETPEGVGLGIPAQMQTHKSQRVPGEHSHRGDPGKRPRLSGPRAHLNSTSTRLSSLRSALSSKARRMGSSSVSMMSAGLARQR